MPSIVVGEIAAVVIYVLVGASDGVGVGLTESTRLDTTQQSVDSVGAALTDAVGPGADVFLVSSVADSLATGLGESATVPTTIPRGLRVGLIESAAVFDGTTFPSEDNVGVRLTDAAQPPIVVTVFAGDALSGGVADQSGPGADVFLVSELRDDLLIQFVERGVVGFSVGVAESVKAAVADTAIVNVITFIQASASDTVAPRLSETALVISPNSPVGVTLHSEDTIAVKFVEERNQADDYAVVLTEAAGVLVTDVFAESSETFQVALADAGTQTLVDSSKPQVFVAVVVGVSDSVRELMIGERDLAAEPTPVGLVEVADVFRFTPGQFPGDDSLTRPLTDAMRQVLVASSHVDDAAVVMTEVASRPDVNILGTETIAPALTEVPRVLISTIIVAEDSLAPGVDEQAPLFTFGYFRADTVVAVAIEATAIRADWSLEDSLAPAVVERSSAPIQTRFASDSLAVGSTEAGAVLSTGLNTAFFVADDVGVRLAEVGAVFVVDFEAAAETVATGLTETGAVLVADFEEAAESVAPQVTEAGAILVATFAASADTVVVRATEITATSIFEFSSLLANFDTLAPALAETSQAPLAASTAVDTVAVGLTEEARIDIDDRVSMADPIRVGAADLAALLHRAMEDYGDLASVNGIDAVRNILKVGELVFVSVFDQARAGVVEGEHEIQDTDKADGVKFVVGGRAPADEMVASPYSSRVRTWWEIPNAR